MNKMQKSRIIYLIIVVLMFAITAGAMFYLPATVTTHWSSAGTQKGSKFIIFLVPVIALVAWLAMPALLAKKADKADGQVSLLSKAVVLGLIPVLACLNILWILNA